MASLIQGGAKIAGGVADRNMLRSEADATERAAAVEAEGLKMRANEARGAAGMAARERRHVTEQVMGKQVALAAGAGSGASTGTILDILGETAARGELQAQTEIYKGESSARGLEDKAAMGTWQAGTRAAALRQKGSAALTGSILEGASKIGEGAYKYGERKGFWDTGDKPASDETDWRTGWRTRVYKAK